MLRLDPARYTVGQGVRNQRLWSARLPPSEPRALWRALPCSPPHPGNGPDDPQPLDVGLAHFPGSALPVPATMRLPSRREADSGCAGSGSGPASRIPRGHVPAFRENRHRWREEGDRRRRCCARAPGSKRRRRRQRRSWPNAGHRPGVLPRRAPADPFPQAINRLPTPSWI